MTSYDDRVAAAKAAISSPLLEAAIDGARGVLLNITGPSSMGLFEMNAAAEVIHGVAHADANIIFGTVVDDEIGDEIRVTNQVTKRQMRGRVRDAQTVEVVQ